MPQVFDVVYHLRNQRDRFSQVERRIVDAILADVAWAAAATIDQLAERAEVSIASISRFARAVGCDDIRDLKLKLGQASAVGARFFEASPAPTEDTLYGQMYADIEKSLRRHLSQFPETHVRNAAALIDKARLVMVAGLGGGSSLMSSELQHRLARLGVAASASSDAVMLRMLAATLTEADVFIVLSLTGATPELIDAVTTARQYGAKVVVITALTSPLAACADIVIPIETDETDFIFKPSAARYSLLFAIDVLATEVALIRKPQSQESLRRIKLALDDYRGGENRNPLGD